MEKMITVPDVAVRYSRKHFFFLSSLLQFIVPRRDLDHLIDYTSPASVTIQRYFTSRDSFYSYEHPP